MKRRNKILERILVYSTATYWSLLTLVLLAPNPKVFLLGTDKDSPLLQKITDPSATSASFFVHFMAYSLGALLLRLAEKRGGRKKLLTLLGVALLHGVVVEWLQGFVPNRWSNPLDALANIFGVVSTGLLLLSFPRAQKEKGLQSRKAA